jgi:subtilisin family serine protease
MPTREDRSRSKHIDLFKRVLLEGVFLAAIVPLEGLYAEPVMVETNRYVVQRRGIGSFSTGEPSYRIVQRHRSFDVVTPKAAEHQTQATKSRTEPLNWSKVTKDCAEILRDPDIRSCDPNMIRTLSALPNDADFSSQWALSELANGADINAQTAWELGVGSSAILVGVIDSGIQTNHPDLVDNIWSNPAEILDGVDNDGNGYIDDIAGANTALGTSDITDCDGHGTHVAGIIGARGNNSLGVTGVSWVTSLIMARTDTDCTGSATLQAVINAYDYFTDLKQRGYDIRVVNASFGGTGYAQAEYDAIQRLHSAGILLVAAAGNENTDIDAVPFYPASISLPNVIAVAATGPERFLAGYSNYGASSVHIAAPGGDSSYADGGILSTWSTSATPSALYRAIQGTSMAAPMVTGALALVASQRSELSGLQLRQLLFNSAQNASELRGLVQEGRFLNVAQMSSGTTPVDQCPDDDNKFTAGVCGCGIADSDLNASGTLDCLDPVVRDLMPARPRVRIKGRRLVLSMENRSGVEWYIEVASSTKKHNSRQSTSKSRYYVANTASASVPKPSRGSRVKIRYAFRVTGSRYDLSLWSRYRDIGVVP